MRQGLAVRTTMADPVTAVERFGPLHASDHRTPYLSLLARVEGFALQDLERAWLVQHWLDRRVAMRGTLHLLPASRLGDVVCAFGVARPEEHRFLRFVGVEADEAQRLRRAIEAALEREGPLELSGLKRTLPAGLRARATEKTRDGRSVLASIVRWMHEAGLLAMTPRRDPTTDGPSDGWTRAPQGYVPFATLFGPLPPCDREQADTRLARWYFEAHGPAAEEDWAWWSGFPVTRSRAAFAAVRPTLSQVAVDGWPEALYVPTLALAGLEPRSVDHPPVVRLLPYEDSGIKAYRATRRRFFADGEAERQQTVYGEVLPTILVDGRVVGTWSSSAGGWAGAASAAAGRPDRGPSVAVVMPIPAEARRALDDELARVVDAIGGAAPAPGPR